jgi:hypothetical protein
VVTGPDASAGVGAHGKRAQPAQPAERTELRCLFEDAAAGLNLGDREVIELRLRQGLAAGEVATVLGVSRGHAYLLLSRAGDRLESSLGVLLVGRAGRGECGDLRGLLAGWDGRLTAALRKRVHRHIEHCATCSARRALELRPARLLNRSPGAALAAGAAESFRFALGAPSALRARTITLAAGHGPGAAAKRSAVLARAGRFGSHGFPRPGRTALSGLAGQRGIGTVRGLRFSGRRRPPLTAVTLLAVAAAAACALAGNSVHLASAATPKPPPSAPAPHSHSHSRPARPAAQAVRVLSPAPTATPATPVTGNRARPAPATPPVSGIQVPGSLGGSTTHDSPFIKTPRQLRSWIESHRLR